MRIQCKEYEGVLKGDVEDGKKLRLCYLIYAERMPSLMMI
jgi:hypothetical protein